MMRRVELRRTGGLSRRSRMPRGQPPTRTATLARSGPIRWRPKRQPLHNPHPMTCPPDLRRDMIAEAGNRCARCRRWCPEWELSLSRILPGSKGGPYTRWNCRVTCGDGTRGCHGEIEASPEMAEREGWRVRGAMIAGEYVGPDDWYRAVAAEALSAARNVDLTERT